MKFLLAASVLLLVLAPVAARAESRSPTCRRLAAEAQSTAALLRAPDLEVQGLRLPVGGELDEPAGTLGRGVQARAALSMSPVDLVRGKHVIAAAAADCERTTAAERIGDVLRHAAEYGRAPALRGQVAFLDEHLGEADALLADAERRLDRHLTTTADLEALRLRRLRLYRKRAVARQELAVLEAHAPAEPVPLAAELARYERAALALDERQSRLRKLAAWDVDLRAGAAAGEAGGEWFGVLAFTLDLGQPWQARAESRYLAARRDELRTADRELRGQLARFHAGLRASAAELAGELELVEAELAALARRRDALAGAESASAHDALAAAELERLDLESDRVFLRTLLAERRAAAVEVLP